MSDAPRRAPFNPQRPWPAPQTPWAVAMTWHDLLFMHWPIRLEILRPHVPAAFEIDTFNGQAWIGVVPFRMTGIRHRLLPALPGLSAFPELNVRTYVRVGGGTATRCGVYFLTLDAAHRIAVQVARRAFNLNYLHARMSCVRVGEEVVYSSVRRRGEARYIGRYRPTGPSYAARPGDLDHWLTERYALFTTDRHGRPFVGEIDHAPWPLQPARAEIVTNTMLAGAGIEIATTAPLLHYAARVDTIAWTLRSVI